jgi:hypothetical protein
MLGGFLHNPEVDMEYKHENGFGWSDVGNAAYILTISAFNLPWQPDHFKVQVTKPVLEILCHQFFDLFVFVNTGVHITPQERCLVPVT